MRKFLLEKLVSDDIVQANLDLGAIVDYKVLEQNERVRPLTEKLEEELAELLLATTEEERAKETEDMRSVLFALRKALGYEPTDPEYIPSKTFDKGHYIITVTVPDGEWADYYTSDPDRFPEVL